MKRFAPPSGAGAGAPGDPLDALLGRLPEPATPPDLAQRTLTAVQAEAALDRLLDQHLPAEVPSGLAERVLIGLGQRPAPRVWRPVLRRPSTWALALAAAALLAVALGLWRRPSAALPEDRLAQAPRLPAAGAALAPDAETSGAETRGPAAAPPLAAEADVDPELLAVLEVLENWETLTDPSVLALELEQDSSWWSELEAALQPAAAEDSDEG
jgi:hypothetical protein